VDRGSSPEPPKISHAMAFLCGATYFADTTLPQHEGVIKREDGGLGLSLLSPSTARHAARARCNRWAARGL